MSITCCGTTLGASGSVFTSLMTWLAWFGAQSVGSSSSQRAPFNHVLAWGTYCISPRATHTALHFEIAMVASILSAADNRCHARSASFRATRLGYSVQKSANEGMNTFVSLGTTAST